MRASAPELWSPAISLTTDLSLTGGYGRVGRHCVVIVVARCGSNMARNFTGSGFDVTIADYLTADSLAAYRRELPGCFVVHLQISLTAAHRRAATRPVYLTDEEFDLLHAMADVAEKADLVLDVDQLNPEEQIAAIRTVWTSA